MVRFSLVVPLYFEQEVLKAAHARFMAVMQKLPGDFEIVYVDDGSRDDTFKLLGEIASSDARVRALRFSRNFGHQIAVTAGIDAAQGDALIIIDADLQDPPELIPELVEKWEQGYEVVYAKRRKREGETAFKKLTASLYYRLLNMFSGADIPLDTGDFRLIDRKVADALRSMREHHRFLRGLAAWAGFKSCPVEYDRAPRQAGETKYTFKKMLKLAGDGITGFSGKPLQVATGIGIALFVLSGLGLLALIIAAICGSAVSAWLFAFDGLLFVQAALFCCIGLLGAYIARMYDDVKERPLYIVTESINTNQEEPQ